MQKFLTVIILSLSIISSTSYVNANSGIVENMFDLNYGVEEYSLNLSSLEKASFSNPGVQKTYDEFIIIDTQLKAAFLSQYKSGNISYYEMQDLISSYNSFVYYTSKTFQYISYEEKGYRGAETSRAIANSYSLMRQNYADVQHILRK